MITAILLAAGAARRFGAPKLLQHLDGKPVVRWSAEALHGAPVDEIIVVVPPSHEAIRRALSGLDVRFVVNPQPDDGMGASLARGIAAVGADTEAIVVALADEPMAGRSALEKVVERFREGGEGTRIVVPRFRGTRGHPVLFERSLFDELRSLTGDQGARAVTDRDPGRVAIVDVDAAKPVDIDTPHDLERLRSTAR